MELAQREFERKKMADGGSDARGQMIPRLPTKAERQVHELTHWPFADWCESCVAARARSDPHRLQGSMRAEGKSEYPVVSMDFCYTRGLEEPEEIDKEDLRLYGGDVKGGLALVVTDDWTRGVMALPTPGKGRRHAKFLAEQVVRYIGACSFSTCIIKADGEPSTRLLVDIIQKCRQKLGFKTLVEHSGPGDSQGNGRVEREIQTVRGLARTLVRRLSEGAGIRINCQGPLFQWAMRHAGWLITHFRRHNGSATAYEQITGRKYQGKLAIFGERVLARLPGGAGDDRFKPSVWLGKTDRADFHIVATTDGLRWTRTIRRLPAGFDATILNNVRTWPWNVSYGQIGTKSTPLMAKTENVALPPDMAGPIRLQERQERQQAALEARRGPQQAEQQGAAEGEGDQRQAGFLDEAASDPTSKSSSSSSAMASQRGDVDDDTLLEDLLAEVKDPKEYASGVETSPKRGGQVADEDEQSPAKSARTTSRKVPRLGEPTTSSSSAMASSTHGGGDEAQPAGEPTVRMVVNGEILADGDLDMEFPDKPPDLGPDELAQVEAEAAQTEILRLIDMGVLRRPNLEEDINQIPTLTTRLVCDWRFRQNAWVRRARLVARDFNWLDPNRSDTFAPTGTQSAMRLIPALSQLQQWSMRVADVKDAYLMCDQPKSVKVVLSMELARQLGVDREWVLGKVLPGQREGAAVWFNDLKSKLKAADLLQCPEAPTIWTNSSRTLSLMVHVDDIVMGGIESELDRVETFLKEHYKLSVESGDTLSFLKRSIEIVDGTTRIRVNPKYIDGLVSLLGGVRRRRTPGDLIIDNNLLETEEEVKLFRSCVGTLLYVSGDRPDVQYLIKELAAKLQSPTKGAMATLHNLVGYMHATRDFHLCMKGTDPSTSFRSRAVGLATGPEYVDGKEV